MKMPEVLTLMQLIALGVHAKPGEWRPLTGGCRKPPMGINSCGRAKPIPPDVHEGPAMPRSRCQQLRLQEVHEDDQRVHFDRLETSDPNLMVLRPERK